MSHIRHSKRESAEARTPHAGDRVRMEGRDAVGIVLCVHREAGTVDVLRMGGMRRVENGIPIERVRVLQEELIEEGEVA